jgi:hypothetical protein
MEGRIQDLVNLLSCKLSRTITLVSKTSSFQTNFPTPLKLDPNRNYEAALTYFSAYNTIFNVDDTNNKFIYSTDPARADPSKVDKGITWKTIKLPNGAYEINQINNEVKRQVGEGIEIGVNLSTTKSYINITKPDFKVDFTKSNTLREMLGFTPQILSTGFNISNNVVQITNLTAIMIHCDLISGSYINGKESNVIYSFPANLVPTGYKINVFPNTPIYLPVSKSVISSVLVRITDEDDKLINFNNEEIVVCLHFRQV